MDRARQARLGMTSSHHVGALVGPEQWMNVGQESVGLENSRSTELKPGGHEELWEVAGPQRQGPLRLKNLRPAWGAVRKHGLETT